MVDELLFGTLPQIIEQCQIQSAGAIKTIDSKFDDQYFTTILIQGRAALIKSAFTGNRQMAKNSRIPSICIQTYNPIYDPNIQDDPCCVKFKVPDIISISQYENGFRYIGSKKKNKQFFILESRQQYSDFQGSKTMKSILNTNVAALYDNNTMELYGDLDLKDFKVEAVFANPYDVVLWNPLVDKFPLDGNSINELVSSVFNVFSRWEAFARGGEVALGEDSVSQPALTRQMANLMIKGTQNSGI